MAPHLGLSSSTTTPAKAAHYGQSLSAALVRGPWSDSKPGIALPGSLTSSASASGALEWSEAVRKWSKHTGGEQAYVHRLHAIGAYYRGHHQVASQVPSTGVEAPVGAAVAETRFSSSSSSSAGEGEGGEGEGRSSASTSAAATSSTSGGGTATTNTSGSSFVRIERPIDDEHEHEHSSEGGDGMVVLGPPVSIPDASVNQPERLTTEQRTSLASGLSAAAATAGEGGGVATTDSASGNTLRPTTTTTTTALNAQAKGNEEKPSHPLLQEQELSEKQEDVPTSRPSDSATARQNPAPLHAAAAAISNLDGDDDLTSLLRFPHGTTVWVAQERRHEVQGAVKDVESMLSRLGSTPWSRPLQLLLAWHHHALGQHAEALRVLEQVLWTPPTRQDDSWCLTYEAQTVDLVRGKVIQGLCLEVVEEQGTGRALEAYEQANQLFSTINYASDFANRREAIRWVSKALARATILSGRSDDLQRTLRYARAYHSLARDWPFTFRPKQRQAMFDIYLRALQADRPSVPTARWQNETRTAMLQGQRLLNGTTSFPRAGETNWAVIRFIERCVELWEDGGMQQEDARQLVSILWWAMTLTFNSHALLRHLTRLLRATGAFDDARRTFELYVQLVLKARQTAQPDTPLKLETKPDDRPGLQASAEVAETEGHADPAADTDEDFIEALVFGVRLLTIDLAQAEEAWRYAVLAGDVVSLSSRPLPERLRARVEEAKGIVRAAMAVQCNPEPEDRPKLQLQAINHLRAALDLHSTPATLYHLAYAQAEARDLTSAVASIRSLLEQDPAHINGWHLLALLLSGQRDFFGALKAIEVGIEAWEAAEEEEERRKMPTHPELPSSVSTRDFGVKASPRSEDFAMGAVIVSDRLKKLHRSSNGRDLPLTPSERLANVIQLRMTEAVILEKIDGPAQAMVRQQQTFSYFSARSPSNVEPVVGPDLGESFVRVDEKRSVPSVDVSPREFVLLSKKSRAQADVSLATSAAPVTGATFVDDDARSMRSTRSASGRVHRLLAKNLHVPSSKRSKDGQIEPDEEREQQPRILSSGSSVYSRQTTPAHSHYHGSRSPPPATPPPPPGDAATTRASRSAADLRVLSNLWLQSAATFRRWGKPEQALGAIQEAEVLDPSNPELWVQLGLYHDSLGNTSEALQSFAKALLLGPDYAPSVVSLGEHYLRTDQADLAHGLLNPFTQGRGWDVPEAWYLLAKTCQAQGSRPERVKECLLYALTLEKSRTCRPAHVCPRWT